MRKQKAFGYVEGRPNIIIVGGGFGGISCAKALSGVDANVVLIDRKNHHLFQPLLYQVATGVLGESDIAFPIRRIFRRERNVSILIGEVEQIDMDKRQVSAGGRELVWDHLVIAAGMQDNYFGNDQWAEFAPGLKSLEQAVDIRNRVLDAFEQADLCFDPKDANLQQAWMTFVVVGGGATGVELAGAIKQLALDQIAPDFKNLDTKKARVLLVEGGERILQAMSVKTSNAARKTLASYGVEVLEGRRVNAITPTAVTIDDEVVEARTVIWAAGVRGSSLAEQLGVELAHGGRVPVEPDLTLASRPDVRVVGDLAQISDPRTGKEVPGVAQGALQMGRYAGKCIALALRGQPDAGKKKPFTYFDKGAMATIGRGKAVLEAGGVRLAGFPAWTVWALVHIFFLVGFRSRVAAMWSWAWAYLFFSANNEIISRPVQRQVAPDATPNDAKSG